MAKIIIHYLFALNIDVKIEKIIFKKVKVFVSA